MRIKRSIAACLPNPYVIAILASLTQPAFAATFTWNGVTSSAFGTGTNWTPNGVPGAPDTAVLPLGPADTGLTSNAPSQFVGTITTNAINYSLTVNSGDFIISGTGINGTNQLSVFVNDTLNFTNSASAGNALITNNGFMFFNNTSNASTSTITNNVDAELAFLDASNAGSATIINNSGGDLGFSSTGSAAGSTVSNNGNLSISTDTSIGALSGTGAISLGANTLTVGNLNQTSTISGNITGSGGITKIGTGNQIISAGNNNYTGLTTVSAGTLTIDTFTTNATVSSGATLSLVNYSPAPASSLALGITPAANGEVVATGTATLGNASLELDLAPGVYNPAMTYTLVQGGVVSGTFASVTEVPPMLIPHLTYTPTSVLLSLEPQSINSAMSGLNASQASLASNLDLIFSQPGLSPEWLQIQGILTTSSEAGIITALNAMSPQKFTAVVPVVNNNIHQVIKSLSARGRSFIKHAKGRGVGNKNKGLNKLSKFANSDHHTTPIDALAQRAVFGRKEAFINNILSSPEVHFDDMMRLSIADQLISSDNRGSPWIQPFGNISTLDSDSKTSVTGYNVKTGGIMIGFDKDINKDVLAGVSGGYSYSDLKFKERGGDSHVSNVFMSLYTTITKDSWHLDGSITGGLVHFKENRNIIFNVINSTAHNSHDGYAITPHVGLGYEFTVKDVEVEPFINLDYAYNRNKGYTETGANILDLIVRGRDVSQLQTEFGVLASKTYTKSYGTFSPSLSLSFVNTKPIKKDVMVSSFIGEPGSFISVGVNKDLNYGSATANATFNYNSGNRLSFAYTANVNQHYNSQQASVVYGINL